jgi:hypothetical protein
MKTLAKEKIKEIVTSGDVSFRVFTLTPMPVNEDFTFSNNEDHLSRTLTHSDVEYLEDYFVESSDDSVALHELKRVIWNCRFAMSRCSTAIEHNFNHEENRLTVDVGQFSTKGQTAYILVASSKSLKRHAIITTTGPDDKVEDTFHEFKIGRRF